MKGRKIRMMPLKVNLVYFSRNYESTIHQIKAVEYLLLFKVLFLDSIFKHT